MIPSGPFAPDAKAPNAQILLEAINAIPSANGFGPVGSPAAISEALPGLCVGSDSFLRDDGTGETWASTSTKLYWLDTDFTWKDVTRAVGGDYATASGDRWNFAQFGKYAVATNYNDEVQFVDMEIADGDPYQDILGNGGVAPPRARYIAVMRDFLLLGSLNDGKTNTVQWSGLNDLQEWRPTENSSDSQTLPEGGPIMGLMGGEVAYVFQRNKVTRVNWVPGSPLVMQFDEVEGGRGLEAPASLVRVGAEAYYFGSDGFYKMDLGTGRAQPIGVGKWQQWFLDDLKPGSNLFMLGGAAISSSIIVWPYISRASLSTTRPDRAVIYDWSLDEATIIEVDIDAIITWISAGVTMDTFPAQYPNLDELPVSLDSSFWKGGAPKIGLIGPDQMLSTLEGPTLPATFITGDGQIIGRRSHIQGTYPAIDTDQLTVEIATRERYADTVLYDLPETMEVTGIVPAWSSGNVARARVKVDAGAGWTHIGAMEVDFHDAGKI